MDEKRRIIYELLVEAKGVADGAKKARTELDGMARVAGLARKALGTIGVALSVGALVKSIASVSEEMDQLTKQLRVFGLVGADAQVAIGAMQSIAVKTGSSLQTVAQSYKDLTDVSEALGLSQTDVANVVEASTIAMKVQGGTAEQAAQQMSTLAFAVEKGTLSGRELKQILKENEILQSAFEIALGRTTKEILAQADAGGIQATELKKVLDVYTELAAQEKLAPTMKDVATATGEASKAFADAWANAIGLDHAYKSLKEALKPEDAEAWASAGEALGDAMLDLLPDLVAAEIRLQQTKRAAEEAAPAIMRANRAAWEAQMAPLYATPAERRESPEQFTVAEGGVPDLVPALKAESERARMAEHYAFLRKLTADTEKGMHQTEQDINVELEKQLDYSEAYIKSSDVIAGIQAESQKAFEAHMKKIEESPAPKILREGFIKADQAAQVLTHSMLGIFSGATHNARDFFRTVLEGLAEVALQMAMFGESGKAGIFGLITGALGGGDVVQEVHPTVKRIAKGAAFTRGVPVGFAAGGIVSSPALFPIAGGRTGMMGEAGAEAIMPLKRSSDGRLGVSGAVPSVVINNQTGVMAEAAVLSVNDRLEITLRAAQMGANLAIGEINRSIRNGYGVTAQSLARSYGLRRRT